ncbi:hypothetical protein [Streptomyces sp. NPDC001930]|uniref:hypothetical protein n=1 Tax=Streptomyces sp. NPDC001930 TaxID=3364625 RepID=UPI0036C3FB42
MDIPDWLVWIALVLIVVQALGLVPVVRRLRGPDLALRSKARFELVDAIGGLVFSIGLLLTAAVADSLFWLSLVGIAVVAAGYAMKGAHLLRTRRHPSA